MKKAKPCKKIFKFDLSTIWSPYLSLKEASDILWMANKDSRSNWRERQKVISWLSKEKQILYLDHFTVEDMVDFKNNCPIHYYQFTFCLQARVKTFGTSEADRLLKFLKACKEPEHLYIKNIELENSDFKMIEKEFYDVLTNKDTFNWSFKDFGDRFKSTFFDYHPDRYM